MRSQKDTSKFIPVSLLDIERAESSIKPYLNNTHVRTFPKFNKIMGHDIYFKMENLQKTGSFKYRGALYTILELRNTTPKKIVTYGTGNHAVALAWAASKFLKIKITAYLTEFTSDIKKDLVKKYGANIIITKTRVEAEKKARLDAKEEGTLLLAPSDNDDMIAGSGTVYLESLEELGDKHIDAVFFPIGGGSISSGTVIVAKAKTPDTEIYAAEPKEANDASMSYKAKKICALKKSPETMADGAKTIEISKRVFEYIKKLNGIYEITEEEIAYWTLWLRHITKSDCEPTSALSIAAAHRWLKTKKDKKSILVIITGQNINQYTYKELELKDYLKTYPNNFYYAE